MKHTHNFTTGFQIELLGGFLGNSICVLSAKKKPYNILFIAVDDLNYYVGLLGSHLQTKTLNMDKLAAEGVVFELANYSAVLSNPSPSSLITCFRANGILNTSGDSNFDWGSTCNTLKETPDFGNAMWEAYELNKEHDKPFMIACGFLSPHLPLFVLQQFFDKFQEDYMILPSINDNVLNDIHGNLKPSVDYQKTLQYFKRKTALQAYLDCINYTDTCVGVLLDALRNSKYAENTIVIFWGDHGWHLGEKLRYKKFTPWKEACRMSLVLKVPGNIKGNCLCKVPIDLYPTITELCGLPDNTNNEGESLLPLLMNPDNKQSSLTWTIQDGQSVRNEYFRYIQPTSGEELFDHSVNDMEWEILVNNLLYAFIKNCMSYMTDCLKFQLNLEPCTPIRKNKIPDVMHAEKFVRGGKRVGYHDSNSTNTGGKYRNSEVVDIHASSDGGSRFCVNSTTANEWLAFISDTIMPGKYFLQTWVLNTQSGGTIEATLNEQTNTSISVPVTPEWQTITSDTLTLKYGNKTYLQFRFSKSGFTINYFEFEKIGKLPTGLPKTKNNTTIINPNSAIGTIYLNVFEFDADLTVSLITVNGKVPWKSGKITEAVEIFIDSS